MNTTILAEEIIDKELGRSLLLGNDAWAAVHAAARPKTILFLSGDRSWVLRGCENNLLSVKMPVYTYDWQDVCLANLPFF